MGQVKAASRGARENMIQIAFLLSAQRTGSNELTAYEIAAKIGMTPQSPRFRDILSTMAKDGKLTVREVKTNSTGVNGGVRFIYRLADHLLPEKRQIPIKKKGQNVDQMSLF